MQTIMWYITLWFKDEPGRVEIKCGNRIKTKHGWGTVIGGNIIVRLDEHPTQKNYSNDKTWTYNIGKEI